MKKLLILDLDETLIHTTQEDLGRDPDFKTDWDMVYKRPYLDAFLTYCFKYFNVAIWTSAGELYTESIVKSLIAIHGIPDFVWSYERCTLFFEPITSKTIIIKDLDKLREKEYDLRHTIIVDDTPKKLLKHYKNLVYINEYIGQKEDNELERLVHYLDDLKGVKNIRTIEKQGWQNRYHTL
jgi:RNA polymerase II subunit A small phosphatase-like protein